MIDLLEAQERLTEVVAGREDYVYEMVGAGPDDQVCAYFAPDGQPSCIVGHALEDELRAAGIHWGSKPNEDTAITSWDIRDRLGLTEDAAVFLAAAQDAQDAGQPWGEALRRANETYRILVADW